MRHLQLPAEGLTCNHTAEPAMCLLWQREAVGSILLFYCPDSRIDMESICSFGQMRKKAQGAASISTLVSSGTQPEGDCTLGVFGDSFTVASQRFPLHLIKVCVSHSCHLEAISGLVTSDSDV